MFLTEKYAIVIDGSLRSDGSRFLFGKGITFFDDAKPMRFGVLPRSGPSLESIKWITLDSPGHVWHTISAWDNPDGVSTFTLRLICRRNIKVLKMYIKGWRNRLMQSFLFLDNNCIYAEV